MPFDNFNILNKRIGADISYQNHRNSTNVNISSAWPKLHNGQIIKPLYNWASNYKVTTTPWPELLGLHQNRQKDSISYNATWIRPKINSQNQYYPSQPNYNNFDTGLRYESKNPGSINPSEKSPHKEINDDDLRQFSESLLGKDVNNAAKYVTINVQSKTTSRSTRDEAPLPLMSIDEDAFKVNSIKKMLNLHNNYILQSNVDENYTPQEQQEENTLLDAIIDTPVMQHTKQFLIESGKIGSHPLEFKETLREIWFNMYARGGRKVGSSGFEHVFLAEIKNNQVSGLHNWLYFYEEEKNNQANYLGYMRKIDLGNKGAILKYHFTFSGIDKPVGSMFIGTSPEFEMALYSTCFLLRADKICPLRLNGHRFIIRTYTYRYRGKNLIGSAFPEI